MSLPNYYRYIAVFAYYKEGVSITFPDLPGCVSSGKDDNEALQNAKEVLKLHLWGMEKDNDTIPKPSSLQSIKINENEIPSLIEVFMPPFREQQNNRFVKKTLSIPYWLNAEAENKKINFSKLLQSALKEQLGLA